MSDLAQFRVNGYVPPEHVITFPHDGRVLGFDQAMRFTGWALLEVKDGQPDVLDAGCLTTEPNGQSGWAGTYESQVEMADKIMMVLGQHGETATMIAHESPPAAGKLNRPDASIMAGMSIRVLSRILYPATPVLMIGKQRAANQLTGNPKAKKQMIPAVLCQVSWLKGLHRLQSEPKYRAEHEYDALAIDITAITLGE